MLAPLEPAEAGAAAAGKPLGAAASVAEAPAQEEDRDVAEVGRRLEHALLGLLSCISSFRTILGKLFYKN